eukprot:s1215_g10.t1
MYSFRNVVHQAIFTGRKPHPDVAQEKGQGYQLVHVLRILIDSSCSNVSVLVFEVFFAAMAEVKRSLGEEFDVVVSGKWRLGAFTFKQENGLRLAAIHQTGALAEWNQAHPDRQVKAGDLLVEVCAEIRDGVPGVRGPGKVLYEELLKVARPCKLIIGAGPLHG